MDPETPPKMDPKSSPRGFELEVENLSNFEVDFEPNLAPTWHPKNWVSGAFLGSTLASKLDMASEPGFDRFLIDFGSILDRFCIDFGLIFDVPSLSAAPAAFKASSAFAYLPLHAVPTLWPTCPARRNARSA